MLLGYFSHYLHTLEPVNKEMLGEIAKVKWVGYIMIALLAFIGISGDLDKFKEK